MCAVVEGWGNGRFLERKHKTLRVLGKELQSILVSGVLTPKTKIVKSFCEAFSKKRPSLFNKRSALAWICQPVTLQCEKAGLYTIRSEGEVTPPLYHNLSKKAAVGGTADCSV